MQSNPLHDMSSNGYPLSDRPTVTEEVTPGCHVPALDRDNHVTPSLPIKKMSTWRILQDMRKPCRSCGTPTTDGSRCERCETELVRRTNRARTVRVEKKRAPRSRGYDQAWRLLSESMRRQQPWCSDCGSSDDLQLDHLPSAWERKEEGLPLRVIDVEVVCAGCNRERGEARPGSRRALEDRKRRKRSGSRRS